MDIFTAYIFLCLSVMPDTFKSQEKVLVPIELEVQTVVNHHGGPAKQTWVLQKYSQFF